MHAARCLKSLVSVLLAVSVPSLAADAPAAPKSEGKEEAKGPEELKKPAKPRVLVTISKETTRITGPLRPDGYVDYIAALNQRQSRGVTPENNAAVLFWKALGPAEIPAKIREKYFQMLGIPPLPPEGNYYVHLDTFATVDNSSAVADEQKKLGDAEDAAMNRPWTSTEFPVIAGWIKTNEKPIALMVKGIRRPRYYEPLIADEPEMLIATFLPCAQESREIARVLSARAMLRLGSGKMDEAWDDLLTCHRLARLIDQGPTLVESLVAIAIDNIAYTGDQALIQYPGLSARQAKKMYGDLRSLAPLSNGGEKINVGERYIFLDCVQMAAREGPSSVFSPLMAIISGEGKQSDSKKKIWDSIDAKSIDWDLILRMGNSWHDRFVEAFRKPNRNEQAAALAKINEDLHNLRKKIQDSKTLQAIRIGSLKPDSEKMGQCFISFMLPSLITGMAAKNRSAMQREVTQLGFALAAYRNDHGSYPKNLAELSPQYVAKIPKDIFTDGDLIYKPRKKGFLLYSVGINGKDDGSRGYDDRTEDEATKDYDDLSVRVPAKPAQKKD